MVSLSEERPVPTGRVLALLGNIPLYGQERQNIEVLAALRERGWEVLVLTNDRWGHLHLEPELDSRGIPWRRARYAARFDRGIGVRGWVERLGDICIGSLDFRAAVIDFRPTHVHTCNPVWVIDTLPALLLSRLPVVYRLGDAPSFHRWPFRLLWRVMVWRIDAFVCISDYVRRELEAGVGPGVHPKTWLVRDTPAQRLRVGEPVPVERRGVTFGYVGQMSPEKGVGVLVDAAIQVCREFDNVHLLLAGDLATHPSFYRELSGRVAAAELSDRIRFLGYILDVPGLLRAVDVHVMPSLCNEALGSTVFEAKRAGRPSIVFPSGGLPETVELGVDGHVCCEKTPAALASAMREYVQDERRRTREGAAARESLARFELSTFGERWERIYRAAERT